MEKVGNVKLSDGMQTTVMQDRGKFISVHRSSRAATPCASGDKFPLHSISYDLGLSMHRPDGAHFCAPGQLSDISTITTPRQNHFNT